jgi:hypothetical protein
MRSALVTTATVLAVAAAASAAGSDDSKELVVRLSGFRFFTGRPPAGWTDPTFDDHMWGGPAAPPFAPRVGPPPEGAAPAPGTAFEPAAGMPLLLRASFSVDRPARARVLELRVSYADGFVAYVNGREIARRGVPPAQPHGPEVEHVYVALAAAALKPGGNLLALEVHPHPSRSMLLPTAPAASVDLAVASGVRIVRGPYLIAPVEGRHGLGLSVAWETDLPATGALEIEADDRSGTAASGERPRRIEARAAGTRQVVAIDELERGRRYRYRVEAVASPDDQPGAADVARAGPFSFETWAGPRQPLRFAVYGDMRYPGHAAHRSVVEALVREAPALVFNTGDLTDAGSEEANWQRYFEITAPLGAIAPVLPAFGNHDAARAGLGAAKSWGLFGLTPASPPGLPPGWTSLDLGGVHFVLLDTNQAANPAQKQWLTADLSAARRRHARAIFALGHEGPWSHGLHGNSSVMARDYAPLLAASGVDVMFSGHDHTYERGVGSTPSGKLTYVVTGGGGAPPYNPTCHAASGPPPGDVPGPLPACPSSVAVLTKTYHYIMVEVGADAITMCPRHPDGSPVEPCVRLPRRSR